MPKLLSEAEWTERDALAKKLKVAAQQLNVPPAALCGGGLNIWPKRFGLILRTSLKLCVFLVADGASIAWQHRRAGRSALTRWNWLR
jgi:hypothetical protein